MEQKYVYDLHADHVEWLQQTAFYRDELEILKRRLSEVASRNNAKEVQAQVEHFQNQLIIQRNQLDHLHHNIKQSENEVEDNIRQNPTAADHRKMEDHAKLRSEVEIFDKLFKELRNELNEFFLHKL